MSQTKPRLNPHANLAFLHCYSRPDPIMVNYVSKRRFLRFTAVSKSSILSTHFFMRRCTIQDLGFEFEVSFENACIRLTDKALFSLMQLARPRQFRLCALGLDQETEENGLMQKFIVNIKKFVVKKLFDSNETSRTQRLVNLSKGATELVVNSSSQTFIPLLQTISPQLINLECDADLLTNAAIDEPMRLNTFTLNQTSKNVLLDQLFHHQIRRLDLRSQLFNEYQLNENCSKQEALKELVLRSDFSHQHDSLKFYQNVQKKAPNLNQLDLYLSTDIELSTKCQQISDEVVNLFILLQKFSNQCEQTIQMKRLNIYFTAYLSISEKSAYEKQWIKNLKQNESLKSLNTVHFVDKIERFGGAETFQFQWNTKFANMEFKAELRKSKLYE